MKPAPWAPPYGEEAYRRSGTSSNRRGQFSIGVIVGTWAASYGIALVVTTAVLGVTGNANVQDGSEPRWFFGVSALALWVPFIVGLLVVSRRVGTGRFAQDFSLRFRPVDLVGIPIGVLCQLVLVGLVTWPFRVAFPEMFSPERVERRAQELFDRAQGPWLAVLAIVVVFGAPFVEELVYRGFIHGGLRGRMNDVVALVVAATWFAGVHLQAVEFPGLFAFALVLGTCFHLTKRLGMSIVAHVAFNATGLLLVAFL